MNTEQLMRPRGGYRPPIRSVLVVRPGDRFTILGIAGTILKIGIANLLVRALTIAGLILLLLILAGFLQLMRG